jgi:hypothetical protein
MVNHEVQQKVIPSWRGISKLPEVQQKVIPSWGGIALLEGQQATGNSRLLSVEFDNVLTLMRTAISQNFLKFYKNSCPPYKTDHYNLHSARHLVL